MSHIIVLLVGLLLAGCVNVQVIPTSLPLPEQPELTFKSCPPDICLSEEDANKLDKYFQKLDAFRDAWQRLRDAQ